MTISELRGRGRWAEAIASTEDPLLRAELLNEQALFAGGSEARQAAERELDRAEARLLQERGRLLHARFLAERGQEDPRELELFERSLELARRAGDAGLEAAARFWIGIVHQVVRRDNAASVPHFESRTRRRRGSEIGCSRPTPSATSASRATWTAGATRR